MEIDPRQLQRVEAGRANITLETAAKVAAGLELALSVMLATLEAGVESQRPNAVQQPRAVASSVSLEAVGGAVTAQRRRAGLTQRQLAERSGVSLSCVQSAECGRHGVSLRSLLLMATALGVEPAELFGVTHTADGGARVRPKRS